MTMTPRETRSSADAAAVVVSAECCEGYGDCGALDRALRDVLAPLGGINAFVAPGQTVLLKPNLLSVRQPEEAVTTHPAVVRALVRLCREEARAARVWIGDSPAGQHAEEDLWAATGMAAVARETGAELKSFQGAIITVPCADAFLPVPAWYRSVDVVISVPKLKTHVLTGLTAGMKNVFGLVAGNAKAVSHQRHPSPWAMAAWLLDVYAVLRPRLTVLDAIVGMEGDGPSAGRPVPLGLVLASANAAALDAVAARMLGSAGRHVPMLHLAVARSLCPPATGIRAVGTGLDRLSRCRLRPSNARLLQAIPSPLFHAATRLLRCRPRISADACSRCGVCVEICPQKAIAWTEQGRAGAPPRIDAQRCILCVCCAEACPRHAIAVRSPLELWQRLRGGWRRVQGKKRALASGE